MDNHLSIAIVSFKSEKIIFRCLKNLKKFKNIFILDNSNDINLKKKIKKYYPNVKFFISKKNLGYPRGNNYLLNKIKTKYALLLNPDSIIKYKYINKLLLSAKQLDDKFAIITPKKNNFPLQNYFNSKKSKSHKKNKKLIEIDKVYFFAPLFNVRVIKKYGFFDKNIFLYYDDLDLCKTLKKNNEKIYLCLDSFAYHVSGKSSKSKNYSSLRYFHWGWSFFYYYRKHYGFLFSIMMFLALFFKTIIRLIYGSFSRSKTIIISNEYQIIKGLLSYFLKKTDYPKKIYD